MYIYFEPKTRAMDYNHSKKTINNELDQFVSLLNELIPKYALLVKKDNISQEELKELGELEYLLLEVNSKISDLKNKLEEHLFGNSFALYYKYKEQANLGDKTAEKKMKHLHDFFNESLSGKDFINWN